MISLGGTIILAPLLIGGISQFGAFGAVVASLINALLFVPIKMWGLRRLAPDLWVSPWSVFRVEEFDRRLWRMLKP